MLHATTITQQKALRARKNQPQRVLQSQRKPEAQNCKWSGSRNKQTALVERFEDN